MTKKITLAVVVTFMSSSTALAGEAYSWSTQAHPSALPAGRTHTQNAAPIQRTRLAMAQSQRPVSVPYRPKAYGNIDAVEKSHTATKRGLRVEGHVGWDHLKFDTPGDTLNPARETTLDNVLYGITMGYDHFIGNLFLGAFGSIDFSQGSLEEASTFGPDSVGTVIDTGVELSIVRDMEIGARMGYQLNEKVNAYALAALSSLRKDIETTTTISTLADPLDPASELTPGEPTKTNFDEFQDGWRLGAGSEVEFKDGVYAKAEYRYTDYGSDANGDDVTRHQFVTGVGLRF